MNENFNEKIGLNVSEAANMLGISKNFTKYIKNEKVIKPDSKAQKIYELYFEGNLNCVCIAKELGVSPQYVSKVLKGHPNYKKEKEIRSKIKYKNYLERKKTNRQLRTKIVKEKEDHEIEYLRHLQWQHAIEMSKKYLV